MIPWASPAVVVAIHAYLRDPRASVPDFERCVNEGAEGCAVRAEDNGWCKPCWEAIVPS